MTEECKYSRLNNQGEDVTEVVSDSKDAFSISELLDIKKDFAEKRKKAKRKKTKKKSRQLKKLCKKTRKDVNLLKKEMKRVRQSVYDNKLNALIACNDPAERKKIAAELKKVGVTYE